MISAAFRRSLCALYVIISTITLKHLFSLQSGAFFHIPYRDSSTLSKYCEDIYIAAFRCSFSAMVYAPN